ncbi:MAG TPA: hypothetical protein PLZ74_10420 [Kiritimatiellia bacterium]|nr:hypothetical protein [Kiritimatiellia bacterium]
MSTPEMRWQTLLVLALYSAWIAAVCHERRIFKRLASAIAGAWASWPPALRILMAGLLLACVKDGRCTKPGGGTNSPAATAQQPAAREGQAAGADTGGAAGAPAAAAPGQAGQTPDNAPPAPAPALPALADGTNCWWVAEGRGPADADADGMPDAWERVFGLDPLDPSDAAGDLDRDGLTALEEFLNRTHPRRRDTDGDGMPDAWEAARRPSLCPWLPDDGGDADGDGLDNFREMALGADPLDPDTNGDGRPDGGEAAAGVDPALDPPDWAAYGTALFSVRVDGVRAARRAGVSVGHITHSGVPERTYALAAGYRYPLTVVDLDPSNTVPCAGTVRVTHDNATFMHGFTNEFPVTFPLSANAPACPPGAEMTVAGIDLDIPDIIYPAPGNSASFPVSADFVPDGEGIAGQPQWSVSGGSATPASGSMGTWVSVTFPPPARQAQGGPTPTGEGVTTNNPPSVEVTVGDRTVTRTLEQNTPDDPDPDDPDPWDGRRFIARSCSDAEPVALTYALAHSSNAVTLAWHGHQEDAVLEWTIGGDGPRFLKDGQEVSRVTRDLSVSVLPRGEVENFTIRAKALTQLGTVITRQTELRVVTIVAEPVRDFYPGGGGPLVNPSGFRVGDEATFKFEFSDNVDGSHVCWSKIGDAAVWSGTPVETGRGDIVLRGNQPGEGTLKVSVENGCGIPDPGLNFKVFEVSAPIPVHVGILCDTNGQESVTLDAVNTKIGLASNIFRQVGIGFRLASVTWITNQGFYVSDPLRTPGYLYTNDLIRAQIQQNDGLEVYFCPWSMVQASGAQGVWAEEGILIAKDKADAVVAHELGHAFGWEDICGEKRVGHLNTAYTVSVEGPVSQARLPYDWNNGPGPEEYYERGLQQMEVIDRLLMSSSTLGMDIPSGRVFGLPREGVSPRLTHVGERDMVTRTPVSQ